MTNRRGNGEGNIYQRSDGTWEARARLHLVDGTKRRVSVYGKTRKEAADRLHEKLDNERRGVPLVVNDYTVGRWLDQWLGVISVSSIRPKTYEIYESTIRLYLKPALGHHKLTELRPAHLQAMIDRALEDGRSPRMVMRWRQVLSSALSEATRQELVMRNVARLVRLPTYRSAEAKTWTRDEAARFLAAIVDHRYYAAFLLATQYGLRLGEVLGLRSADLDFETGVIHVRQQLQRHAGHGLQLVPLKTLHSARLIPMTDRVRTALRESVATAGSADADGLVFRSTSGGPVDPKNFVERTFKELCELAGVPKIKFHELRHTAATFYKDLGGANPQDAQRLLGHSHVNTTMQIYQHSDLTQRRAVVARVEQSLTAEKGVEKGVDADVSKGQTTEIDALTSGGPGGARTLDTLLKSSIWEPSGPTHNRGGEPVQACSSTPFLGPVGVETGVESDLPTSIDTTHPHVSCPLGHDTEWLLRELHDRLNAHKDQAGGDRAA
jgi:integrase